MATLRNRYLSLLRDTPVSIFSPNGFPLKGRIVEHDDTALVVYTEQYETPKNVLSLDFVAIVPFTFKNDELYQYNMFENPADTTLRQKSLGKLLYKDVCAITPNGFRMIGRLVAYDDTDIVIETYQYEKSKNGCLALVHQFVSVIPE